MAIFVLSHQHRPEECRVAIAAWKGYTSPLRGGHPLGSCASGGHRAPQLLDAHRGSPYRVARAWCSSHHEAEDLVQETFARVLTRPRVLGPGTELCYRLRALRNTHISGRRPATVPMLDMDLAAPPDGSPTLAIHDLLAVIATAPEPYRSAVLAIDVLGLSSEQAASRFRTRKGTISSRLSRGRAHAARALAQPGSD